ncbi:hypothetical protein pdam_00003796 [Pocillopora damicornis]|uniref:Prolyl endopeptidase n=1 Tax=Pocillopora damicornis TaxID=46731 RepID=A0A3M6T4T0_POCDA|nr:hypothetical protein pdam_00003796 [Pocillopora damicornis]
MQVSRLAKSVTFAACSPYSSVALRGLSSISIMSRLFGGSFSEPKPKKVPSYLKVHGVEIQDEFQWLKDRGSRAVRNYVKQENRYCDAVLSDTEAFQENLTNEMKDWFHKHFDDESVPEELDGYIYYLSNPPKDSYLPVYCRRKISEDGSYGDPETILDQNELKERYNYVSIPRIKISPSGRYIGFLLDKSNTGMYTLFVTEAHEGIINFIDAIPNVVNFEWGCDDLTIYYSRPDEQNRPFAVLMHKTCQSVLTDVVLHEEKDERFIVDVSATKDREFITINCNSRSTSEVSIVDIKDGSFVCKPLHPRQQGMEYYVDHRDDQFYIITNADEKNYRVEKHSFSVLPSFDSSDFCCTRLEIQSKDGTHIPVTLFHHKDLKKEGSNPLLLHAPMVSMSTWVLIGGGELGREWYLDGKLQNKHKGFEDFEACAKALHNLGYSNPQLTAARGTSAGGLIVGAVCNRSPELFKAVILKVPFLDILTSMLDPSLPLTVQEYEEWGEPGSNESDFHYIKSYCPYQNIKDQVYPSVMVTTAMNDDRVPYWLPLKWVARLRDQLSHHAQGEKPLVVCHVEYYGGHSETEGVYHRIEKK